MALLPGATIKGEWKYFHEMTTEDLEYLHRRSKVQLFLVCGAIAVMTAIGLLAKFKGLI